ncbi:serine hydrolase domain-containing protein [Rhodococcus sp. NPDC060086]|uniref:serine hydrolase domain-containing protein n=1 Tax=unclassified Rhodococcus (in: high G+C Gram-positive bacteria) TaxID=192944 RepID=UPI00366144C4
MRRLTVALTAALLVFATACGSDDSTDPATGEPTVPDTATTTESGFGADLQSVLDRVHSEVGFPGVVARVASPDGEWTGAAGSAGGDEAALPEPIDHTRIGSVTKTMTVTALLQLMDGNLLSLDDPVGRYVPGLPNGDTATLGQLAAMTSGIPSYTFDDEFQQKVFADPTAEWTPEQLLDLVRGDPPNFAPGEKFEYSNSNTIALGLVIEEVSGQSLGDYFQENLFGPLGAMQTTFPTDASLPSPRLQGVTEQGQPEGQTANATDWNPSWAWSAGAVTSTVDDLEIWGRALGTGQGILTPEAQRLRLDSFQYNLPPATPQRAYGLGLGIEDGWVGHTGELPGYNTYVGYLPETQTVLVVAVNSDIPTADGAEPVTVVVEELRKALQ